VNRTAGKGEVAAALAGAVGRAGGRGDVAEADLLVNATSVGMGGTGELPVDPSLLRPGQVVAELVVHPVRTPLLEAAAEAGCVGVDGVGMLVHQAAIAFEAWTGVPAPLEVMGRAARIALKSQP
jgi:shikimate dehydrogenase